MKKQNVKSQQGKILNEKKGITLIALVITIIVLLILAGVSIATLTGDNGILNQAQRAKEETEIATDEEQRRLAMAEAATNFENTKYNGVIIPSGFAPTRIDGENTVDEGLVIIDSKGNEFVWIPVEDSNNYNNANRLSSEQNWPQEGYTDKNGWTNKPDPEDEDAMEKVIKESVKNKKGFYVARYEAGVPENAKFYVDKNSENKEYAGEANKNNGGEMAKIRNVTKTKEDETGIELKPVSKKGNQSWNFISQENAVKLSKNMYKNSTSVNSYLIDSNAWNYICEYIFKEKKNIDITDSSKYGNYRNNTTTNYEGIKGLFAKHSGMGYPYTYAMKYEYGNVPLDYPPRGTNNGILELATGICDDFKLYNIYDMAGNMREWTSETVSLDKDYAVFRGGSFSVAGTDYPVVRSRGNVTKDDYDIFIGFRCVLYLK